MSVFLRWGIFGILGVAALVYAYNASKHMAEKRAARDVPAAKAEPLPDADADADAEEGVVPEAAPQCETEIVVARRALEARNQGEPLDRLLRSQEIAFEEPPRRERLEKIARDWFNLEGTEPSPEALRAAVIDDCVKATP